MSSARQYGATRHSHHASRSLRASELLCLGSEWRVARAVRSAGMAASQLIELQCTCVGVWVRVLAWSRMALGGASVEA